MSKRDHKKISKHKSSKSLKMVTKPLPELNDDVIALILDFLSDDPLVQYNLITTCRHHLKVNLHPLKVNVVKILKLYSEYKAHYETPYDQMHADTVLKWITTSYNKLFEFWRSEKLTGTEAHAMATQLATDALSMKHLATLCEMIKLKIDEERFLYFRNGDPTVQRQYGNYSDCLRARNLREDIISKDNASVIFHKDSNGRVRRIDHMKRVVRVRGMTNTCKMEVRATLKPLIEKRYRDRPVTLDMYRQRLVSKNSTIGDMLALYCEMLGKKVKTSKPRGKDAFKFLGLKSKRSGRVHHMHSTHRKVRAFKECCFIFRAIAPPRLADRLSTAVKRPHELDAVDAIRLFDNIKVNNWQARTQMKYLWPEKRVEKI
jgi:hypothetical protein